MKDIDFDELDRAVSSVLGQKVPNKEDKPAETEEKGETATSEASTPDAVSADVTADAPAAEEPVAQKPTVIPLAIKRRGKFMDVMHPSADMKPVGAASVKPARTPPVITPLLTEEVEPTVEHTAEPTASLDESHSLIGAEPTPISETLPDSVETTEPEPVAADAPGAGGASLEEPVETDDTLPLAQTEIVAEDAPTSTESLGTVTEEDAPAQTTPFLSDTQVEKRPLGAFGEADANQEATDESPDQTSETDTSEMQPAPATTLPRELQPDVVGVESVQATETLEAPTGVAASPFAAKVGVAPETNDGRVEGHPLFDTSTYHEPIAAVHQGVMPGWAKWLIGLLVCLAIGAGVGYFLFTAGL